MAWENAHLFWVTDENTTRHVGFSPGVTGFCLSSNICAARLVPAGSWTGPGEPATDKMQFLSPVSSGYIKYRMALEGEDLPLERVVSRALAGGLWGDVNLLP